MEDRPAALPLSIYESDFKTAPTGSYLLSASPDPVILAVNDVFLAASSRKREDLVGVRLFAAFPENPDDPKDTGVAALRHSLERVIATGKPDTLPLQRYPIRVRGPEGEEWYEERFWSAINTPIFDQDGKLACISHRTTDITRQTVAERALRKSEARYRRLFDSIDQGFCTIEVLFDTQGRAADYRFIEVNPAFEAQTGLHGAVGKRMRELAPQHEQFWFDIYGEVARSGKPARFEHEAQALGRWYDVYALRADETDHNVVAILFKDITEQKRTEASLRLADRRKDEFLAMLAHELRNPLAPISAAADVLTLGAVEEGRVRQTSAIIARQARYMTGLIDDLLDVSRVTRGLIVLEKKKLDAKRIVADAVEQVRPLIEARRHRLAVHLPPDSAFVVGDQKRLVQVMSNLLNNAAKYTPEGGDIVLAVQVDGASVRLSVADNGIGMEPELVEHVFELFSQAERTSDRSQGGLGIGLSLVRSLLELHGGSVSASSEGPGKGSCFTVCLPHVGAPAASDALGRLADTVPPKRKLKILVADDNVDAAATLAMLVEAWGYEVLVEHNSLKALESARAQRPDVCLLDIGLPGMDGNELARELRAQPETAGAVLLAVTGYGQEQDRTSALRSGFDDHFVKPINSRKLAALLAGLSDGKRPPLSS